MGRGEGPGDVELWTGNSITRFLSCVFLLLIRHRHIIFPCLFILLAIMCIGLIGFLNILYFSHFKLKMSENIVKRIEFV